MWRYATARTTGTSHLKTGSPCQDRFACLQVEDDIIVLALADGAGSGKMSESGAEAAVNTVVDVVEELIRQGGSDFKAIIQEAVVEARKTVQSIAIEQSVLMRDLASTLLVVIMGKNGGAAAQIGDGVIAVRSGDDEWCWVFWPQHGEFVNTTRFLTEDDALDHLQVDSLPAAVSDLVLLSDGLERLALNFSTKEIFEPFFTGLSKPLVSSPGVGKIVSLSTKLEAFIKSERICSRSDDDISLILATSRPQPPQS
jgi:hypothetical protein